MASFKASREEIKEIIKNHSAEFANHLGLNIREIRLSLSHVKGIPFMRISVAKKKHIMLPYAVNFQMGNKLLRVLLKVSDDLKDFRI